MSILRKRVEAVYVGFPFGKFKSVTEAHDWMIEQDGYKNKEVWYEVRCHSSVEVD